MKTATITPRKIFSVWIDKREYDVYDIHEKEHQGLNGEPKTWWLYYSDRLPEDMIPPADSQHFRPYSKSMLRRLWDIRIKQTNSTKEKWGDTNFRNHVHVEMYCDNKLIYEFGTGGSYLEYAFAKIQYLMVQLAEHPYDFFDPEKEVGRKIYWKGLPATIATGYGAGEIRIIPDYTDISKDEWWKELGRRETMINKLPDEWDEIEREDRQEAKDNDGINWGDALSDKHINWFRH